MNVSKVAANQRLNSSGTGKMGSPRTRPYEASRLRLPPLGSGIYSSKCQDLLIEGESLDSARHGGMSDRDMINLVIGLQEPPEKRARLIVPSAGPSAAAAEWDSFLKDTNDVDSAPLRLWQCIDTGVPRPPVRHICEKNDNHTFRFFKSLVDPSPWSTQFVDLAIQDTSFRKKKAQGESMKAIAAYDRKEEQFDAALTRVVASLIDDIIDSVIAGATLHNNHCCRREEGQSKHSDQKEMGRASGDMTSGKEGAQPLTLPPPLSSPSSLASLSSSSSSSSTRAAGPGCPMSESVAQWMARNLNIEWSSAS